MPESLCPGDDNYLAAESIFPKSLKCNKFNTLLYNFIIKAL